MDHSTPLIELSAPRSAHLIGHDETLGPESDVDVLVVFDPKAPWDLWDFARLEKELGQLLGRKADVVESSALRNPFFRHEVLRTCEVVYAA